MPTKHTAKTLAATPAQATDAMEHKEETARMLRNAMEYVAYAYRHSDPFTPISVDDPGIQLLARVTGLSAQALSVGRITDDDWIRIADALTPWREGAT